MSAPYVLLAPTTTVPARNHRVSAPIAHLTRGVSPQACKRRNAAASALLANMRHDQATLPRVRASTALRISRVVVGSAYTATRRGGILCQHKMPLSWSELLALNTSGFRGNTGAIEEGCVYFITFL